MPPDTAQASQMFDQMMQDERVKSLDLAKREQAAQLFFEQHVAGIPSIAALDDSKKAQVRAAMVERVRPTVGERVKTVGRVAKETIAPAFSSAGGSITELVGQGVKGVAGTLAEGGQSPFEQMVAKVAKPVSAGMDVLLPRIQQAIGAEQQQITESITEAGPKLARESIGGGILGIGLSEVPFFMIPAKWEVQAATVPGRMLTTAAVEGAISGVISPPGQRDIGALIGAVGGTAVQGISEGWRALKAMRAANKMTPPVPVEPVVTRGPVEGPESLSNTINDAKLRLGYLDEMKRNAQDDLQYAMKAQQPDVALIHHQAIQQFDSEKVSITERLNDLYMMDLVAKRGEGELARRVVPEEEQFRVAALARQRALKWRDQQVQEAGGLAAEGTELRKVLDEVGASVNEVDSAFEQRVLRVTQQARAAQGLETAPQQAGKAVIRGVEETAGEFQTAMQGFTRASEALGEVENAIKAMEPTKPSKWLQHPLVKELEARDAQLQVTVDRVRKASAEALDEQRVRLFDETLLKEERKATIDAIKARRDESAKLEKVMAEAEKKLRKLQLDLANRAEATAALAKAYPAEVAKNSNFQLDDVLSPESKKAALDVELSTHPGIVDLPPGKGGEPPIQPKSGLGFIPFPAFERDDEGNLHATGMIVLPTKLRQGMRALGLAVTRTLPTSGARHYIEKMGPLGRAFVEKVTLHRGAADSMITAAASGLVETADKAPGGRAAVRQILRGTSISEKMRAHDLASMTKDERHAYEWFRKTFDEFGDFLNDTTGNKIILNKRSGERRAIYKDPFFFPQKPSKETLDEIYGGAGQALVKEVATYSHQPEEVIAKHFKQMQEETLFGHEPLTTAVPGIERERKVLYPPNRRLPDGEAAMAYAEEASLRGYEIKAFGIGDKQVTDWIRGIQKEAHATFGESRRSIGTDLAGWYRQMFGRTEGAIGGMWIRGLQKFVIMSKLVGAITSSFAQASQLVSTASAVGYTRSLKGVVTRLSEADTKLLQKSAVANRDITKLHVNLYEPKVADQLLAPPIVRVAKEDLPTVFLPAMDRAMRWENAKIFMSYLRESVDELGQTGKGFFGRQRDKYRQRLLVDKIGFPQEALDRMVKTGEITDEDMVGFIQMADRFAQFSADPLTRPIWANTPAMKLAFTLSNYSLQAAGMFFRFHANELLHGNPMPMIRLLAGGALLGEGLLQVREAITGDTRRDMPLNTIMEEFKQGELTAGSLDLLERLGNDAAAAGTMGLVNDIIQFKTGGVQVEPTRSLTPSIVNTVANLAKLSGRMASNAFTPPEDMETREWVGENFRRLAWDEITLMSRFQGGAVSQATGINIRPPKGTIERRKGRINVIAAHQVLAGQDPTEVIEEFNKKFPDTPIDYDSVRGAVQEEQKRRDRR